MDKGVLSLLKIIMVAIFIMGLDPMESEAELAPVGIALVIVAVPDMVIEFIVGVDLETC